MVMTEQELWRVYQEKNNADHAMIKQRLDDLAAMSNIVPLVFKWVVFPLILVLGGALGVERVFSALG